MLALLQAVETRPRKGKKFAHQRLALFVHITSFCGLRYGEIAALTLQSLHLEDRLISVRSSMTEFGTVKAPKTRAGVRDVPMPRHVVVLLTPWLDQWYIPNPCGLLFQSKRDNAAGWANFHRLWGKLLDAADIPVCPEAGRHHFHALRHFAATHIVEAGLPITDVAAVLGHSTFDTTLQVYAHAIIPGHRRLEISDRMAAWLLPMTAGEATVASSATNQSHGGLIAFK